MEEIYFFEYSIHLKKCNIIKYECIGKKVGDDLYSIKLYNNNKDTGNHKLVHLDDFEKVHSLRIMSFKDDITYYQSVLLNAYEEMITETKNKVLKQEKFLENLKLSIK